VHWIVEQGLHHAFERPEEALRAGAIEPGHLLEIEPGGERVAGAGEEDGLAVCLAQPADDRLHHSGGERVLTGAVEGEGVHRGTIA
jgi:hypothetical protein